MRIRIYIGKPGFSPRPWKANDVATGSRLRAFCAMCSMKNDRLALGVSSGSKCEILIASRCFPICSQNRTLLRPFGTSHLGQEETYYLCWVTTPSANSGATSLGSNQVAPSERQMCAFARSDIGVSRQPSRKRTFCWFTRSAIMCEPHREQKRRNLPGDDSYDLSRSSPLIHRND